MLEDLQALEYTQIEGVKELSQRRRSFDSGPREMHKATCSDCGKECEVPFKPTEGRPVYCQECFEKHRPPRRY
jgi:CxxC-x17-CxxC domain-containing protein